MLSKAQFPVFCEVVDYNILFFVSKPNLWAEICGLFFLGINQRPYTV